MLLLLMTMIGHAASAAGQTAPARRDHLSGAVGGPGGEPFYTRCPDDQVVVGLAGRSGTLIDRVAPVCVAFDREDRWIGEPIEGNAVGGPGGGMFWTACPRDTAVTAFTAHHTGQFVVNIRLECRFPLRRAEPVPAPPPVGGQLDVVSTIGKSCSDDEHLSAGILGGASQFINRFGISCDVVHLDRPVRVPRPPVADAPLRTAPDRVFVPAAPARGLMKTSIFAIQENGDMTFAITLGMREGTQAWARRVERFGSGWNFRHVFSIGDGVILAITQDGRVLYYRCRCQHGEPSWIVGDGLQVAEGWPEYMRVFSGGGGAIFALDWKGKLFYYQYLGLGDGSPNWGATQVLVEDGWDEVTQAFASGADGAIFSIDGKGDMRYRRYGPYRPGHEIWTSPTVKIGSGWYFYKVFSPGDHVILAVTHAGAMLWYRFTGLNQKGEATWHPNSSRSIGPGWQKVQHIFAY